MSEAKPTPGPCYADGQVVHSDAVTCIAKFGDAYPDRRWSGTDFATEAHKEANAELFADALNVLTDTGLTPSQLVEQRDQLVGRVKELEEALNCITSMCETHGDFSNGVTDPTGTIDEGNVIAGRIVGDARAVLTKYRTNAADVKEHHGASVGTALPAGWVPLTITHEGQYPEEVAYGPKIMMDRLGKWLGKYFAHIAAPEQMPDLQSLHNLLYLAQRQTSLGAMQRVVSEARLDLAKVRDAALSKARPNTAEGEAAQQAPAAVRENLELRRMLCIAHAGAAAYMDDGEAQDSSELPLIDFLHDTPAEIQDRLQRRALKKLAMTTEATPARWPSYEVAVSDPVFQVARSIMGTENMGQDRQLVAAINHVIAAAPAPAAAKEPSP